MKGRKRVLLFPPSESFNVYAYPTDHIMDNFAMVDVERPDLKRFPAFRRAKPLETTLEPGDVLWMPSYYWHYVRQARHGKGTGEKEGRAGREKWKG